MEWKQIFFQNISTYLDIINNFLSENYSIESLGNYVKVQGGYAFKNSEYKTSGIPIIRISDFQNEKIVLDNTKFYDEKPELSRYELEKGDIIIAMTGGTIGKLAVVQEGLGKIYLNQRVGKFEILDKNKFHKEYVYWIARGVEEKVKRLGYGGAQPNVSNKQIENLQFPFPEKEIQKSIVNFLNDFMNKKLIEDSYFDKHTENLILKIHNTSLKVFKDIVLESENSILNLKKLKEAILQEAVQGKLVEQNSNDEPASILLEKIRKEKEQLIKEKKIKKEKPLPEITKDEIPYELPNGWEWVRLGDIVNIFSGNSFNSSDFNLKSGTKVIKITNVGVNEFIESDDYLPNNFIEKYDNFIVKENDILLALTRPYISAGLKVCLCSNNYNNSLLNQRVCCIKSILGIDNYYLYYFLSSSYVLNNYKGRFEGKGLQPNLRLRDVTDLIFPFPPLEEQKRIVKKVDQLMAYCDELEQEINQSKLQAEQLMQSVLKEAFDQKEEVLTENG